VLVLEPGNDAASLIHQANTRLQAHQRIRDFSLWPGDALPRTEAIRKLKREEIRRWLAGDIPTHRPTPPAGGSKVEQVLAARHHLIDPQVTLDELGLTSLDRIELALALEEQAGITLSETAVAEARTVADLQRTVDDAMHAPRLDEALVFSRWSRNLVVRAVRRVNLTLWVLPLAHVFVRLRIEGREHLNEVEGPAIFAANHQSLLDVPTILLSLPRPWRWRMSVAMAKDLFAAHFDPADHPLWQRLVSGIAYYLAVFFFNAFPVPRSGPGTRATLRYAGTLASNGFSILIFPEGHRTERGEINAFQPGVGMMAARLRLPVIPVRLEGLDRVMHYSWWWPRRGDVRVIFGPPLQLKGHDHVSLAKRVEEAVVDLLPTPTGAQRPDAA
jgi:long-chain acyl-CoA synthetase